MMDDRWLFYQDHASEWRWRRTAPNGRVVGASSEGYDNRPDCEANARRHGWNPFAQFLQRWQAGRVNPFARMLALRAERERHPEITNARRGFGA